MTFVEKAQTWMLFFIILHFSRHRLVKQWSLFKLTHEKKPYMMIDMWFYISKVKLQSPQFFTKKLNSIDWTKEFQKKKSNKNKNQFLHIFWSLDLLAAIQGITLSPNILCAICSNIRVFHHVLISSLDMFKNRINSYHIHSKQV